MFEDQLKYARIYFRLAGEGHAVAKQMTDDIAKYGVKEVVRVEDDTMHGEHLTLNSLLGPGPKYFVGILKESGEEIVTLVK